VRIGTSYNVRLYAQSFFNTSSTYTAVASITPAKDTTAPSIPTGLTAVVGTGRAVSLDWNDNTEPDFSEYGIYRNTTAVTPANANTNKVAEVRASRFVDTDVTIGTTYYYWLNAYDNVENVSGFTNYVQATPSVITAGPIDPTPPSTPNAPTVITTAVYLSSDGGSFSRVSLTAPPLPSGAVALDVLYRRTGASDWILGNQVASSVSYAVSIDDLSVGVAYEFAARGISFSGALSAVSSVLSQSAPSNTTTPTTPSSGTLSGDGVKPKYLPGTQVFLFGTRVGWAPNTQSDFSYFEVKATTTDTDAATDYSWTPNDGTNFTVRTTETETFLYSATLGAGFVRVRAVNRTGTPSAWLRIANANAVGNSSIGSGSVAKYNSDDVNVTGIKTGAGSSTRQVNVVYEVNEVVTLTGGGTTENVNISLTNRGFSTKPDDGLVVVEDVLYQGFYDSQAAGSTSTNAVVKIYRNDGGVLGSGGLRLSARFTDYT
jgi:hypothetical protein